MAPADCAPLLNHSLPVKLHKLHKPVLAYGRFIAQYWRFKKLAAAGKPRFALKWRERWPCLADGTAATDFDRHYVIHPAWAARVLTRTRPAAHVDISSSLTFVALISAFIPTRFYDYRPADLRLGQLTSGQADLTALPFPDGSIASLSCMHVVEHIGLGRYGDPLNPDGDLKAMGELQRVLAPGGTLLFVVPVGKPRICYNAHRIYSHAQIVDAFPELRLREFALIPDDPAEGNLLEGATAEMVARQHYGCGCFWFERVK